MMINQQYLSLALSMLVLGATNTEAFAPSTSAFAVSGSSTATPFVRSLTYLCAEEEAQEGGDAPAEPSPAADAAPVDILNSPDFLKRKIDVLKSDIQATELKIEALTATVEEGKAEWGPQLEKLQSESANVQERLGNQNKQGDTMATVQVVREMLGVLDNYDRALGSIEPTTDEEKEIEAEFKATYAQILETFDALGVKTVETIGTEFDYEVHQAVMQMPTDEFEEGIVCSEMGKGFILGETLIRAAMVAVAR